MINVSVISTIYRKEMKSFFTSALAYVIMVVFLSITAWFYVNNIFLNGYASMRELFSIVPYIFLFMVPALTMRMISEEKKNGTIELLATKPIRDIDIVMSKFLASWSMIVVTLLPTIIYYFSISSIGSLDDGQVFTGYLGLILMASIFSAIGVFASSLTENQVIAFIIGFILMFIIFMMDKVLIYLPSWAATPIEFIGVDYHFRNIARGVLDTRDIIYFGSMLVFILFGTKISLERRKW